MSGPEHEAIERDQDEPRVAQATSAQQLNDALDDEQRAEHGQHRDREPVGAPPIPAFARSIALGVQSGSDDEAGQRDLE